MTYRRMAARARADLAWLLLGVALLQLGLAAGIEGWLPQLRDPYYAYRALLLQKRIREAASPPAVVLMLGSSRTQNGFRGAVAEAELSRELGRPVVLFGFGVPGSGPVRNLIHWRRLLARGVRPDLLLVEVVPIMLGAQEHGPLEMFWLPADRLWHGELAVLQRYRFPARKLRKQWWRDWPVPWFSHRMAIVSAVWPDLLPADLRLDRARDMDGSGWTAMAADMSPEGRRRVLDHTRQEHGGRLQRYQLHEPACEAVAETLALCRREGIAAALVVMPEGSVYRGWCPPAVRAQVLAFLGQLRRAYAVPVIDAHDWNAEEDFYDSNHLLPDGAAHFTGRLAREHVLPLLRRLPAR